MDKSHLNFREEEQILYQRVIAGDEQAFNAVHTMYKARLLYYGKKFLDDWSEVEDIVADAFFALWKHRQQLQSDAHIRNFLFLTVRNGAINFVASKDRRDRIFQEINIEVVSAEEIYDLEMVEEEMMHILDVAIETLPKECRRIFELSWQQDKTPAEIARILDMNPATVRSQKRRAILLLQDWVKKNAPALLSSFLLFLSLNLGDFE